MKLIIRHIETMLHKKSLIKRYIFKSPIIFCDDTLPNYVGFGLMVFIFMFHIYLSSIFFEY